MASRTRYESVLDKDVIRPPDPVLFSSAPSRSKSKPHTSLFLHTPHQFWDGSGGGSSEAEPLWANHESKGWEMSRRLIAKNLFSSVNQSIKSLQRFSLYWTVSCCCCGNDSLSLTLIWHQCFFTISLKETRNYFVMFRKVISCLTPLVVNNESLSQRQTPCHARSP